MFRALPPFGGDERAVAEVVNGLMNGKSNNTGSVTIATGGATTTTIYDSRISADSVILLVPKSAAAYADTAPYGAFQDSTDQTASAIDVATATTFDTTDFSNGVTLSNSSRINFANAGVYNIQFSYQFKNTTNDVQSVDIWFRKNGSDIEKSNSRFGIPARKSSGSASHLIAAMNFFVSVSASDYVQLMWRPSDVGVSIEDYPAVTYSAGVTPAIPVTPSVIATVNYVAPAADTNVYVSSQTTGQATLTHFANSTSDKTYAYVVIG